MARRVKGGIAIGRTITEHHTGATGYPVQGPQWAGDDEERIPMASSLYLTRHSVGWVLRLADMPLVSLNEGDLEALGLTLIRASAR